MSRPLFQYSSSQLEDYFVQSKDDLSKINILLDELEFRKTPLSKKLKLKVEQFINARTPVIPTNDQAVVAIRASNTTSLAPSFKDRPLPSKFTLIQEQPPLSERPSPYRPELSEDLSLEVSPSDPLVKYYRIALNELIGEMKRKKRGIKQYSLEDGALIGTEGGGNLYQFTFVEESNLFEGANVELLVGGIPVPGNVIGISQGKIIISVRDDYGPTISTCILRIDNTALIKALHDRLEKIEKGEVSSFRSEQATRVIRNEGDFVAKAEIPHQKAKEFSLNEEQEDFIKTALSNEITWLWGPPGTGKTQTLQALTQLLFEQDKRTLVCSNTNQAVDQVLLKLCKVLDQKSDRALEDGKIVRLGRIDHQDLSAYADKITIEGIVIRKSQHLQEQKTLVEEQLQKIILETKWAEETLRLFEAIDSAEKEFQGRRNEFDSVDKKLKEARNDSTIAASKRRKLEEEYQEWMDAGALRRVVMRKESVIATAITKATRHQESLKSKVAELEIEYSAYSEWFEQNQGLLEEARQSVHGRDRQEASNKVKESEDKKKPLREELSKITAELEKIQETVLKDARIVGATITRTYLRPKDFTEFDVVIIDEASMILLPAVFHAAGIAKEKVVIAGDFRQLPPILQTEQKALFEALGRDVFEVAGITNDVEGKKHQPRLIQLKKQYRMHRDIGIHVSEHFYNGTLTHEQLEKELDIKEPLKSRLTIIDTSAVHPFCNRNLFSSRYNLMHALIVRNVVFHLRDSGFNDSIGICSPYSAQSKLLKDVLKTRGLAENVRASTVHGFQGDEREIMVLDLVDSIGERNVGVFLQANRLSDDGAKLLNVALSRAKQSIIIVGNLTFLDERLPSDSYLRRLLFQFQKNGKIVDARQILPLLPITQDLDLETLPDIQIDSRKTGLFGGSDFERLFRLDLEKCSESVVIYSGFITSTRVAQLGDLLRKKLQAGIKVRCVTRPPKKNGNIPEENGREALNALEQMGVAIDLRSEIHEKVVIIDRKISWFGSLNILSSSFKSSELMARVDDPILTEHLASLLSIRRKTSSDAKVDITSAENPRCPECGAWSVFIRGKKGPFFECERDRDEWTQSFDAISRPTTSNASLPKSINESDHSGQPCPICSSPVKKRNGRYGAFYSCSKYPKCKGILKVG
jgi:superfamily I DNA and/or RNA helicase/ssDNA-binding Zn-finger/Zn-ribbon topoisomerase 1